MMLYHDDEYDPPTRMSDETAAVVAAWEASKETADFYAEFKRRTGLSADAVKGHYKAWWNLTHAAAEEVAAENGTTIRAAGFQAYLADVLLFGRPRICAIIGVRDEDDGELDPNPRRGKPWPKSEDCPTCWGRAGKQYEHAFGCTARWKS